MGIGGGGEGAAGARASAARTATAAASRPCQPATRPPPPFLTSLCAGRRTHRVLVIVQRLGALLVLGGAPRALPALGDRLLAHGLCEVEALEAHRVADIQRRKLARQLHTTRGCGAGACERRPAGWVGRSAAAAGSRSRRQHPSARGHPAAMQALPHPASQPAQASNAGTAMPSIAACTRAQQLHKAPARRRC